MKKVILYFFIIITMLIFTGCSSGQSSSGDASVLITLILLFGFIGTLIFLGLAGSTDNKIYMKISTLIFIISIILIIIVVCTMKSNPDSSDGVPCENCGRRGSVSDVTGYCKSCDESFLEWQKETYSD